MKLLIGQTLMIFVSQTLIISFISSMIIHQYKQICTFYVTFFCLMKNPLSSLTRDNLQKASWQNWLCMEMVHKHMYYFMKNYHTLHTNALLLFFDLKSCMYWYFVVSHSINSSKSYGMFIANFRPPKNTYNTNGRKKNRL